MGARLWGARAPVCLHVHASPRVSGALLTVLSRAPRFRGGLECELHTGQTPLPSLSAVVVAA